MRKIIISIITAFSLVVLLTSCSVYKIDVQQGNTLEAETLGQLQLGMSRQQVSFLLGTALVKDPFHANRWDYVYTFTPGGGELNKQHLTLHFTDDRLSKIDKSQITGYTRPKIATPEK